MLWGEQCQIERELRVEGTLDEEQRRRLLEIVARTPVRRLFTEATPISTDLAPSQPPQGDRALHG